MNKDFKALVEGQQEFVFSQRDIDGLRVIKQQHNGFHLLHDRRSINAEVVEYDFANRSYQVRINGNIYRVNIIRDIDNLIKSMGYSFGSSRAASSIEAPMPGIIIGLPVKKGQSVKKGDTLLVLEAMKMENTIVSPMDAVIKRIHVAVGDTVNKNKLLVDFE